MPSDISFENSDWRPVPQPPKGCESAWTNGQIEIGGYHLGPGPDKALRNRLNDLKAVRDHYRAGFAKDGIGLIECHVIEVEGARAVHAIGKIVLPSEGATYVGTVAIPLSLESYVFNTIARESGITGVRETAVMLRVMQKFKAQGYVFHQPSGEPSGQPGEAARPQPIFWKNPATGAVQRWCQDPYEPNYEGPCLSNLADAPEHDEGFPDHPLSQVRATLRVLKQGIRFSAELKKRA